MVAPTTLLTGLLFYFGRIYANGSFEYFGVNFTALDLTVADYLVRSADGLIIPMIVAAGAAMLGLWIHQYVLSLPNRGKRTTLRVLTPLAATVGLVLVSLAVTDLLARPIFPSRPETRGLNFSVGVLLLAYAVHLSRLLIAEKSPQQPPRRPPVTALAEWGFLFILVSVGLFWAAGSYAHGVATQRARQIEASLPGFPAVTIFSEKKLSLQAPTVGESPCSTESAYRFRYEGLKLILQSGDQYLFLPESWTHADGTAFLIPRSDDLRLEFYPPGQPRHSAC